MSSRKFDSILFKKTQAQCSIEWGKEGRNGRFELTMNLTTSSEASSRFLKPWSNVPFVLPAANSGASEHESSCVGAFEPKGRKGPSMQARARGERGTNRVLYCP
jgi:hypothetical protein